jgi:UTP--glucose-1-phosphate uridylyltransferase
MELLEREMKAAKAGSHIALSPALEEPAKCERYLATEVDGGRYNIGVQYGLLKAQVALALSGKDRNEILAELLGLVAESKPVARHPLSAGA